MSKLPHHIQDLMTSSAYKNTSHPNHKTITSKVNRYFQESFKGEAIQDETGRIITNDEDNSSPILYKWEAEENACKDCQSQDGKMFEDYKEATSLHPMHQNCKCEIVGIIKENKTEKETRFDKFVNKLISSDFEGTGYEDRKGWIDKPTNSGITQPTLDAYIERHPEKYISNNLKELDLKTIKDIYKEEYYENKKIDKIKNERIAYSVFDMGVMTNPLKVGSIVQESLNEYGIKTDIDGIIGNQTISTLNSIENIEKFMKTLKENRKNFLQQLDDFSQFGIGWTKRTDRY